MATNGDEAAWLLRSLKAVGERTGAVEAEGALHLRRNSRRTMDGLHDLPPNQNVLPVPKFPSTSSAAQPPPPGSTHLSIPMPGERLHSFSGAFGATFSGSLPVIPSTGSSPSVSPQRPSVRPPAPPLSLPSPTGSSPSCSGTAPAGATTAGPQPSSPTPVHPGLALSPGFVGRRSSHSHSNPNALIHDLGPGGMPHSHGSPLPLLCDPAAMLSTSPMGPSAPGAAARHTLSGAASPSSPSYLPSIAASIGAPIGAPSTSETIPPLGRMSAVASPRPLSARGSGGGAGGSSGGGGVSLAASPFASKAPPMASSPTATPGTPPGLSAGSPVGRTLRLSPSVPGTSAGGAAGGTSPGQGGGQSPAPIVRFHLPDSGPSLTTSTSVGGSGMQASPDATRQQPSQSLPARQLLRPTSAKLPPGSALAAAEALNGGRRLSMTGAFEQLGGPAAAGPQRLVLAAAHELRTLQQQQQLQHGLQQQQDGQLSAAPSLTSLPSRGLSFSNRPSTAGPQLQPIAASVSVPGEAAPAASPHAASPAATRDARRSDPGLAMPALAAAAAAAIEAAGEPQPAAAAAAAAAAAVSRPSLAPLPSAAVQAAAAAATSVAVPKSASPPRLPHPPLSPHATVSPHALHRAPRQEGLVRRPSATSAALVVSNGPGTPAAAAASQNPKPQPPQSRPGALPPRAGIEAPVPAAQASAAAGTPPVSLQECGLGSSLSSSSKPLDEEPGMDVTARSIAAVIAAAGEDGCDAASCAVASSVRQPLQAEPLRFPRPVTVPARGKLAAERVSEVNSSLESTPRLVVGPQLPPCAPSSLGGRHVASARSSLAAAVDAAGTTAKPSSGDASAEGGVGEGGPVGLFLEGGLAVLGGDLMSRVRDGNSGHNSRYSEAGGGDLASTVDSTALEGTLDETQTITSLPEQMEDSLTGGSDGEKARGLSRGAGAAAPPAAPAPKVSLSGPGATGGKGAPSSPGAPGPSGLEASLGSLPLKALVRGGTDTAAAGSGGAV